MDTNIATGLENVTGKTSTTTQTQTAQAKLLGKDDFMKLLLAQLKNQDPLNPMDGTDFTAQLAQFSSLEQLSNLNTELKVQSVNQMTLGYAQSVNMIGKEVVASDRQHDHGKRPGGQPELQPVERRSDHNHQHF